MKVYTKRSLGPALRIVAAVALQMIADQAMAQIECDPLKIALEHIARRYPNFDPNGLKQVVLERGNLWEFTYELPNGTLGGAPIVTVNKRICAIVRSEHTQ